MQPLPFPALLTLPNSALPSIQLKPARLCPTVSMLCEVTQQLVGTVTSVFMNKLSLHFWDWKVNMFVILLTQLFFFPFYFIFFFPKLSSVGLLSWFVISLSVKCCEVTRYISYSQISKPQLASQQPRELVEEREIDMMRAAGICDLK